MTDRHPQLDAIDTLPYHRWLGIDRVAAENGRASFTLVVAEHCANSYGVLHGGIVASLCDVVAYAALMSTCPPGQLAATHDFHMSVMRPTSVGAKLKFEGEVVRKGQTVAFLDARVLHDDKLVATARVTKTLLNASSVER